MNIGGLKRLEIEQKKELLNCQAKIDQWEKFKTDYEDLQNTLNSLPDNVNYDIMVPLGTLALLPGKLIHTNEILVLLGDNWFAERSCKQACEIVKRRLIQCEEMLKKLSEEKKQHSGWLDWTNEMEKQSGEYVDIIEEYDPEKEAVWKEQHKMNVQKYKQQQKIEREKFNLQEYLSSLEETEENDQEDEVKNVTKPEDSTHQSDEPKITGLMNLLPETSSGPSKASGDSSGLCHNRGRRVSWHDETVMLGCEDNSDSSDSSSDSNAPLLINFHHTTKVEMSDDEDATTPEANQIIKTPADIYIHFASWFQKIPKSILKPSTPIPKEHDLETIPSSSVERSSKIPTLNSNLQTSGSLQSKPIAFEEFVVERETKEILPPSSSSRPVSRFKAQKLSSRR